MYATFYVHFYVCYFIYIFKIIVMLIISGFILGRREKEVEKAKKTTLVDPVAPTLHFDGSFVSQLMAFGKNRVHVSVSVWI